MLLIQIPTIDNIDELKNKIEEVSNELINIEFEFLILDHSKLNYSEHLNLFRKENKFNKINYYHLEKKSKKNERGLASRFGYEKAIELHEDVDLIEIDSDTAHRAEEIIKIYNHAKKNKCDIVVASKYLDESKVINRKISRIFISAIYNYINKKIFKIKITDTSNSYRYYSKLSLINYIDLNLKFVTPIAHLLILIINKKHKLKFGEVDTIYLEDINSKSSINFKQLYFSLIDYLYLIFLFITKKTK